MSKTGKLLLLGMTPLAVGCVQNVAALYLGAFGLVMDIIGIVLLILWGYVAYRVSDPGKNPVMQSFLLCSFGLLMLVLALYRELIVGQYWFHIVGFAAQAYFLPLLSLISCIFIPVVQAFMPAVRPWPFYIVIWACMFAAGFAGCLRKRNGK